MATMRTPIDIPVLMLRGEHDAYLLDTTFQRGKSLSPHRTLVPIPRAGHYAHQENPSKVNEVLTTHWREQNGVNGSPPHDDLVSP